jgi:hypothetical protein
MFIKIIKELEVGPVQNERENISSFWNYTILSQEKREKKVSRITQLKFEIVSETNHEISI